MVRYIKKKRHRIIVRAMLFVGTLVALLSANYFLGEFVTTTATIVATVFHLSGFAQEIFG